MLSWWGEEKGERKWRRGEKCKVIEDGEARDNRKENIPKRGRE